MKNPNSFPAANTTGRTVISALERREFLKLTGLASLGFLLAPTLRAHVEKTAGGVIKIESVISADKRLPAGWVKSLFGRGAPEVVTDKDALMHIGMPAGGLFCGTVYLGGDGKLWVWDIFNDNRFGIMPKVVSRRVFGETQFLRSHDGSAYIEPSNTQPSPFQNGFPAGPKDVPQGAVAASRSNKEILADADQFRQGFALRIAGKTRTFDRNGWKNVSFTGTYPIGTVDYSDPASPVSARLEAFSPFIPLNTDDSSLPVTLMRYTLKNTSGADINAVIGGWLDNAVCINSEKEISSGVRKNRAGEGSVACVLASAEAAEFKASVGHEDTVFEDFEKEDYAGWTVEGTAFGDSPLDSARIPPYMGDIGMQGSRAAISHNVRDGGKTDGGDKHTGKLISKNFKIERSYICFLIAGGNNPGSKSKPGLTGLHLYVDGKLVDQATGRNANKLRNAHFDVRKFAGKEARLEIVDNSAGAWGNIIVDNIIFTDNIGKSARPIEQYPDCGTLCLALAEQNGTAETILNLPPENPSEALFSEKSGGGVIAKNFTEDRPLFGIRKTITIPAGGTVTVTFAIAWHFPNTYLGTKGDTGRPAGTVPAGRHYLTRFKDAGEVAAYVAGNIAELSAKTFLWRDTWYDSTLPTWFLDRTFANTSTLATSTSNRFNNGRFYGLEGIGVCTGTCIHVWQYAQAPARLFPEIERYTRENVDLGIGLNPDGHIGMRGEHKMSPAIDGQCGRIMGMWREHCMSPDDTFLKRIWPRAKKAVEYVLNHDADGDGILDGAQENTLDAAWYGKIAWISIEALGALAAGEKMAEAVGDADFAKKCRDRRLTGQKNIEQQLFNGEYFYQIPESGKEDNFGTYNASYIDQLFGQSMAYQCGLGDIIAGEKAQTALKSIWKYNFSFDLTDYLKYVRPLGRGYYTADEGGTLMCTNARNEENPYGGSSWTHGYLNECMSGFEHQLASHMMRAGLVQEALAVTRAVHDRYNAAKRNPYNEIECSDHYARAMASYGTFLSACGYDYNGPEGKLTFAPKMTDAAGNFKAAFTTAEGWGTFEQKKAAAGITATIAVKYGKLRLNELTLAGTGTAATILLGETRRTGAATRNADGTVTIKFSDIIEIAAGETLAVTLQ